MGRIKGSNSDYKYEDGGIKEVKGEKAFLKIFICPGDAPSRVEEHEGEDYCKGTDKECPAKEQGHALLELHEENGATMQAGETKLTVKKEGIILQTGKLKLLVQEDGIEISGAPQLTFKDSNLIVEKDLTVNGKIKGKLEG
jgi:hypothetical protein